MNSRQRYAKMAKAVRRAAQLEFNRNMKTTHDDGVDQSEDKELVTMYRQDKRDLLKVAKFIGKGQITQAMLKIERLDTAVYEQIPCYVYDYVLGT